MSADLAVLVTDPSIIERSADPAVFIIEACERAKAWLREVLDHGDIETISEIKSQAEAIRVYTMQKQLGKDAELSAAEVVRRAERGIGVAIRRGQDDATIKTPHDGGYRAHKDVLDAANAEYSKPSPTDFAARSELSGNGAGIYHMTDGVADEEFDAAIEQAKAERNLTRANVVRKIRQRGQIDIPAPGDRHGDAAGRRRVLIREWAGQGYTSRQIGERLGMDDVTVRRIARETGVTIDADEVTHKTRHIDSARIVRETADALEGLAIGIQLADVADLDPVEAANWAVSFADSIRILNRFARRMKEIAQ